MAIDELKAAKNEKKDSEVSLKEMQDKLKRLEETSGRSGAISRTPKQMMLDARELEQKDPEHHYRFVSSRDPQKVQGRIMEGYAKVPESEGGRDLGGLILMKIPRRQYESRVANETRITKERLSAHTKEMRTAAESVAKELRDKHGISVPMERIFVSE